MSSLHGLSGPFIASVSDWTVEPEGGSEGVTYFRIHVSSPIGGCVVLRRYRDFARLAREVLESTRKMPRLPPRSFFRRRVTTDFLERRRQGLTTFLAALLASDPYCTSPALRDFLGSAEGEKQCHSALGSTRCPSQA